MSLSARIRFEILKRDGFRCVYCGAEPGGAELRVDHVVPVAGGGGDEPSNLVAACFSCNAGKSDIPLDAAHRSVAVPTSVVADRTRVAAEIAADRVAHALARDSLVEWFLNKWESCVGRTTAPFRASIPGLVDEWSPEDLITAIVAVERKGLDDKIAQARYFHGVLRNMRARAEAEALSPDERERMHKAELAAADAENDPNKRAAHRRAALRLSHSDTEMNRLGCDLFAAGRYGESFDAFARAARSGYTGAAMSTANAALSAYHAGNEDAAVAWARRAPGSEIANHVIRSVTADQSARVEAAARKAEQQDAWRRDQARAAACLAYDRCVAGAELGLTSGTRPRAALAAVLPAVLGDAGAVLLRDVAENSTISLAWLASHDTPSWCRERVERVPGATLGGAMRALGWRPDNATTPAVWRPEAR